MHVKIDFEKTEYVRLSDNCIFDHNEGAVIIDGRKTGLTATEAKVLSYLIENNGYYRSPDSIYEYYSDLDAYLNHGTNTSDTVKGEY